MNTLTGIVAAIGAALTADLGSFDLNSADQVQEGTWESPPGSVAFACLPPAELVGSEPQAQDAWYLETWRQTIRAWAPCAASTPDSRASTSRQLGAQIVQVLDRARLSDTPAATAPIWGCAGWAVTGVRLNPSAATAGSTWAYAEITVTLSFQRLSGRGA